MTLAFYLYLTFLYFHHFTAWNKYKHSIHCNPCLLIDLIVLIHMSISL